MVEVDSPREKLLALHKTYCDRAHAIMKAKNQDYGADTDPFRNFRSFGELGILVRLSDKLSRLRTYIERGEFKVEDESVKDTALDAINYVVLLLAMIEFGDECNKGRTTI